MGDYEAIVVETQGGLATITMNRPDRMNGMTTRMLHEAHDALLGLASDRSVRVVLLTGAGRGFCPGADLSGRAEDGPQVESSPDDFHAPLLLHEMPQVTVAAINGACAGAGFGWAAACDIRFAARSANFNTAFINVSVAGDMGLPWSLPRLVGAAKARELSFLGEKFSADEAQRIGLVAAVFDDADFRTEVAARVDGLLARSPQALRTMKLHYVAAERMGMGDFIDLETSRHANLVRSPEATAAFKAFADDRNAERRAAGRS